MSILEFAQIVLYFGMLVVLTPVLGGFMARVFTGERTFLSAVVGPQDHLAPRAVTRHGARVGLTLTEYALLRLMIHHAGRVLTHAYILREVSGPEYVNETHYLRVYSAQLRQKLEDNPALPGLIVTEPGVGYRLVVT